MEKMEKLVHKAQLVQMEKMEKLVHKVLRAKKVKTAQKVL
jgi:hypothetical protein